MKAFQKIIALVLVLTSLLGLAACGKEEEVPFTMPEGFEETDQVSNYVCIQMNTGKAIVLELFPDTAPITVANFQKLVSQEFYNGLIFHRVISGFMIQGGDPDGNGTGGPGWSIKGEFASNGVVNNLKHTRGTLSMARSNDPNSAGSQFFIMHKANYGLDGNYAAFGKVVQGMGVVDEIATCQVAGETPVEKQMMERVFFVKNTSDPESNIFTSVESGATATEEESEAQGSAPQEEIPMEEGALPVTATGKYEKAQNATNFVCIKMNSGKEIVLELYPDIAPITVANFQRLVLKKFYDGVIFHRVIPGFMIQGGDPDGNGSGGPGWTIKGEFSSNGVKNDLKHTRGVLSMARTYIPDSAGSQFFIMHDDAPHLDGEYAAFGKVIQGLEVVDEIASCKLAGESPVEKQIMQEVYFVKGIQ